MAFDKSVFAARLRGKRAEADISQEELASKCGISTSSVIAYESGDTCPLFETACALAEALGCTPNDLIGWGAN